MENEDEELQFRLQWGKRQQKLRGIIVVSGLPSTMKTEIACAIGKWATCPVLCINHFFCHKPKAARSTQEEEEEVKEEEERITQENAFTNLCKVAGFHMKTSYKGETVVDSTVVIKSRLNTTFELEQLLQLVTEKNIGLTCKFPLLIIESQIVNKYHWKRLIERYMVSGYNREYKGPRTWAEMEKVRDDYYDSQSPLAPHNWDLYVQKLMSMSSSDSVDIVVRRLLIDTLIDISVISTAHGHIRSDVLDAITFLFTAPHEEIRSISQNLYTVELRELRPYLLEKRLRNTLASKGRTRYLCPNGDCNFSEVAHDINDVGVCGVCGKQVDFHTQSAYACRLCILTLHKSCAERINFKVVQVLALRYDWVFDHDFILSNKYRCDNCVQKGKSFSKNCGSCAYQSHLKSGVLPIILNHKCHPHFLSLMLKQYTYYCKACAKYAVNKYSYCCMKCGVYYHLRCCIMPLELLKHKHGGHEHVMKLVFSCEEDHEESYWCDVCYEDMGLQDWSYMCDYCPYYNAHTKCAGGFRYLANIKDAKFVQQLQSQLEDLSLS